CHRQKRVLCLHFILQEPPLSRFDCAGMKRTDADPPGSEPIFKCSVETPDRSPMTSRPRSGRVYAKATRARQTGTTGVICYAMVEPNRILRMNCRRESHIAAMSDRLEPVQKTVHTGICRLAMVVVMPSGYIGWHYRAAPNAFAAPDGELVKVA